MTQSAADQHVLLARLGAVVARPENKKCCDCSKDRPPWVFILKPFGGLDMPAIMQQKRGGFCCNDCAEAHLELGVNISDVRRIRSHNWTENDIKILEASGNAVINSLFESNINDNKCKPRSNATPPRKARFVEAKYKDRKYLRTNEEKKKLTSTDTAVVPQRNSSRTSRRKIEKPRKPTNNNNDNNHQSSSQGNKETKKTTITSSRKDNSRQADTSKGHQKNDDPSSLSDRSRHKGDEPTRSNRSRNKNESSAAGNKLERSRHKDDTSTNKSNNLDRSRHNYKDDRTPSEHSRRKEEECIKSDRERSAPKKSVQSNQQKLTSTKEVVMKSTQQENSNGPIDNKKLSQERHQAIANGAIANAQISEQAFNVFKNILLEAKANESGVESGAESSVAAKSVASADHASKPQRGPGSLTRSNSAPRVKRALSSRRLTDNKAASPSPSSNQDLPEVKKSSSSIRLTDSEATSDHDEKILSLGGRRRAPPRTKSNEGTQFVAPAKQQSLSQPKPSPSQSKLGIQSSNSETHPIDNEKLSHERHQAIANGAIRNAQISDEAFNVFKNILLEAKANESGVESGAESSVAARSVASARPASQKPIHGPGTLTRSNSAPRLKKGSSSRRLTDNEATSDHDERVLSLGGRRRAPTRTKSNEGNQSTTQSKQSTPSQPKSPSQQLRPIQPIDNKKLSHERHQAISNGAIRNAQISDEAFNVFKNILLKAKANESGAESGGESSVAARSVASARPATKKPVHGPGTLTRSNSAPRLKKSSAMMCEPTIPEKEALSDQECILKMAGTRHRAMQSSANESSAGDDKSTASSNNGRLVGQKQSAVPMSSDEVLAQLSEKKITGGALDMIELMLDAEEREVRRGRRPGRSNSKERDADRSTSRERSMSKDRLDRKRQGKPQNSRRETLKKSNSVSDISCSDLEFGNSISKPTENDCWEVPMDNDGFLEWGQSSNVSFSERSAKTSQSNHSRHTQVSTKSANTRATERTAPARLVSNDKSKVGLVSKRSLQSQNVHSSSSGRSTASNSHKNGPSQGSGDESDLPGFVIGSKFDTVVTPSEPLSESDADKVDNQKSTRRTTVRNHRKQRVDNGMGQDRVADVNERHRARLRTLYGGKNAAPRPNVVPKIAQINQGGGAWKTRRDRNDKQWDI